MKGLQLSVALLGLRMLAFAGADIDHLLPLDPTWSPKYREILGAKLGVTPFDCGRVVFRPPFQKTEESISIYFGDVSGQVGYTVTCAIAEENIWDATNGGELPDRAKDIKIERVDAHIPEQTAKLLKQAWSAMLQGVRGGFPPAPSERQIIPGDPTQIEFSLQRPNESPLCGQLNVFLESQGSKVKALMALSEDLITYCQAQPDKRPLLASKIDQRARDLIAQLQRSQ